MASGPFYDEGVYVGEVVAQGLTKSSTGNTQFVLRFKVLGKPDPHDQESLIPVQNQYERTIWMTITEKTAERIAEDLRRLGYSANSFGPLDPSHQEHESFAGNQIDLYCKHESDQSGNPRERWNLSRQGGGLKIAPLEPKDVRALDMLFGKALKGAPLLKSTGVPMAAAESTDPPREPVLAWDSNLEITDDDIPF